MTEEKLEKAALRGEPSYIWRAGQERRLRMILDAAGSRTQGRVLDVGCGVGMYLKNLAKHVELPFGTEYDFERAKVSFERGLSITCAAGEDLPFPSGYFDLVLSHEVLEHVEDDRTSVEEIVRVLRPPTVAGNEGGRLILFVPNRGYPFETHGIYWRGSYRFGNKPFVNYLPRRIRDQLAPHVRAYSANDIEFLFEGLPTQVIQRTTIYGAYDNLVARWPSFGRILRTTLQSLERTPLRVFGLSHFWVIERT
ncbi:MAG: methyltransferase domain-containing protein [Anaerolineales bacterium]|nr:methyltransferase domain-containing protein [Anaerolineales bacterium]